MSQEVFAGKKKRGKKGKLSLIPSFSFGRKLEGKE